LATGLDEFMKRNTKLLEDAATNQKTTTELGQQLTELQKKLKTALEKSNSGNTQPKSRVSFLPNRSFWAGSFLTGLGTLGVWKFGGILLALLPKLSWLLPL
jgi:hypothetical protein